MEERRRSKRTSLPSKLIMKELGGENKQITIKIVDVSKTGLGFECKEQLKIGEVYEAHLTIWTKEVIHAIVQVVRIELKGKSYSYGAIFMGMPDADSARIEVYQTVEEARKK